MGPEPDDGPEERLRRERRELGVDHALVGAVLVRRWGLPSSIAAAVERHHSPDADGHRRGRPARRPDRPSRGGRPRLADVASKRRRAGSASTRTGCVTSCSSTRTRRASAAGPPSPARSRPARSTRCAGSPRARSTSRSPRSSRSRSRRSAPTFTTSTRRSARSTAPRPSSSRASAAGSSQRVTRSGRCAGRSRPRGRGRGRSRRGEGRLRVGAHRLGAQARPACDLVGRVAVGEELQRLALAPGERPHLRRPSRAAGSMKLLRVRGGFDGRFGSPRGASSWPRRRRRRPRSPRSRRGARPPRQGDDPSPGHRAAERLDHRRSRRARRGGVRRRARPPRRRSSPVAVWVSIASRQSAASSISKSDSRRPRTPMRVTAWPSTTRHRRSSLNSSNPFKGS